MKAEIVFVFFLLSLISHLYTDTFIYSTKESLLLAFTFLLLLGFFSLFFTLVGWVIIDLVLASSKNKLPRFLSGFLGLVIGIVLALILNKLFSPIYYSDFFKTPSYSPDELGASGLSLSIFLLIKLSTTTLLVPSTFMILMLSFVGWRISQPEIAPIVFSPIDFGQQNLTQNTSYFQRAKSIALKGIKIGVMPTIISVVIFEFYDSIFAVISDGEGSLVYYAFNLITIYGFLSLILLVIETSALSLVLALWKNKIPNIASGFLGLTIGAIVTILFNYLYAYMIYGSASDFFSEINSSLGLISIFFS